MKYGPADGNVSRPVVVYGMSGLTAMNHCIVSCDVNVRFGLVRWTVSVSPLAETPEMCEAVPARNWEPPTSSLSSWMLTPYGEPIFGLRIRSNARENEAAVTGEPSE